MPILVPKTWRALMRPTSTSPVSSADGVLNRNTRFSSIYRMVTVRVDSRRALGRFFCGFLRSPAI